MKKNALLILASTLALMSMTAFADNVESSVKKYKINLTDTLRGGNSSFNYNEKIITAGSTTIEFTNGVEQGFSWRSVNVKNDSPNLDGTLTRIFTHVTYQGEEADEELGSLRRVQIIKKTKTNDGYIEEVLSEKEFLNNGELKEIKDAGRIITFKETAPNMATITVADRKESSDELVSANKEVSDQSRNAVKRIDSAESRDISSVKSAVAK